MSTPEIFACLCYAISVWLAARNSVHTWWTGIIGSVLYGYVFFTSRLYADVTLQVFFIATSVSGWYCWLKGKSGDPLPVRNSSLRFLLRWFGLAVAVAVVYGAMLHFYTDAFSPFVDSLILTFSVLAQLLLMNRRLENWYFWLAVNTLAIPLYAVRELYLTAGLYTIFWLNAWHGLYQWKKEFRDEALS